MERSTGEQPAVYACLTGIDDRAPEARQNLAHRASAGLGDETTRSAGGAALFCSSTSIRVPLLRSSNRNLFATHRWRSGLHSVAPLALRVN
jgi:hypothetical protein